MTAEEKREAKEAQRIVRRESIRSRLRQRTPSDRPKVGEEEKPSPLEFDKDEVTDVIEVAVEEYQQAKQSNIEKLRASVDALKEEPKKQE